MSFTLAVNDRLELKLYATNGRQYSINTRHYRVTESAGAGATDATAATALSTLFATNFKNAMVVGATFLGVSVQIVKPIRRPKVVATLDAGDGQYAGEPLPSQVTGLIRILTDEASRHGRGRMYVPFPSEGANGADGKPTGAYLDELHSIALKLDDDVNLGGGGNTAVLQPVIYNRATNAVIEVQSASEAGIWGTQRRRSDARGGDRPPF